MRTLKSPQSIIQRRIYKDVDAKVIEELRRKGWDVSTLTFQEFRNQSSLGTFGMDRDWGVKTQEYWIKKMGADGGETFVRNNWLMKNGKSASLYELQNDGSEVYSQVYESVTGQNAMASFHEFTTPFYPESFKDIGVLENLRDPQNVKILQSIWGDTKGRTLRYKAEHILNDKERVKHISLFDRQQEVCRALTKEIDTKILPVLKGSATDWAGLSASRMKATQRQGEELRVIFNDFSLDKIDPAEASLKIRLITGGRDLPQVLNQIEALMKAGFKFGNVGK